jgi:predicted SAM-dependent methyltransferase
MIHSTVKTHINNMGFNGVVERLKALLESLKNQLPQIRRNDNTEAEIYGALMGHAAGPISGPNRTFPIRRHGSGIFCPICAARYQSFLPFGLNGRRHARCPGCGSLERHRFLYIHLQDTLRWTRRRLRFLHIAPEPCIQAKLAPLPQIQYRSIDLFDPRAGAHMDVTCLDYKDCTFDAVLCSHVLEHVSDDHAAIAELYRILASGGRALVMVPLDLSLGETEEDSTIITPAERHARFGHPYHVRICGADYHTRFSQAGFEVSFIESKKLSRFRRRHHRLNKCVIYDCRKPASG